MSDKSARQGDSASRQRSTSSFFRSCCCPPPPCPFWLLGLPDTLLLSILFAENKQNAMLFSLALVPLALAASAIAASHGHKRHHSHGVAKRARGDVSHTLAKRFDNARWSFYDVGL